VDQRDEAGSYQQNSKRQNDEAHYSSTFCWTEAPSQGFMTRR
jgi:hypothetical protein